MTRKNVRARNLTNFDYHLALHRAFKFAVMKENKFYGSKKTEKNC